MEPRKLIFKNSLSPGDIVMLTAALRDLHRSHPGEFVTDVRTSAAPLWEHNPHVTQLDENDASVEVLECHYPLIGHSNQRPFHFIHGFAQFVSESLGVSITPTEFRGDIYLSKQEQGWISQVHELIGTDEPFWIVAAGGKWDFTIKWWSHLRFQEVVDHFTHRIQFVQVGETGHNHPLLRNVIDLRGKTNIRQLVRLVYHSQGILCPVTFLMHLAAAVPTRPGAPRSRPCVVVAGGREPVHWEAYPGHRYLHTQGALSCCETGGCWKSRTVPLGDGDEKDLPQNLCQKVTLEGLPRCMDMIRSDDVIRAIESYFEGGIYHYLKRPNCVRTTNRRGNSPLATLADVKKPRISLLLEVCGLRRSGLHIIMNWLLSHYNGNVTFINDANHRKVPINQSTPSDLLPCIDAKQLLANDFGVGEDKLLLVGFEDEKLLSIKSWNWDEALFGQPKERKRVLVLRDPFNLFASRLRLARNEAHNPFSLELLMLGPDGTPFFPELWKRHAREFLGQTNHLGPDLIRINYNRWASDVDYRKEISSHLGREFNDVERERVPSFGFGSSFDGIREDRNGTHMRVSERWREFSNDPQYRDLFADTEILDLAETIFGKVVSENFLTDLKDECANST